jgi:hypothetical protein
MNRSIVIGFAMMLALAGCSPATSRVTGKVTRNGTPVTAGTVVFFPEDNKTYLAEIGPDGRYEAVGVPRGKARVAVQLPLPRVAARPDPPMKARDGFAKGSAGSDDAGKMARMPQELPVSSGPPADPKFADPSTSGLTLDIAADPQTFDIDLK